MNKSQANKNFPLHKRAALNYFVRAQAKSNVDIPQDAYHYLSETERKKIRNIKKLSTVYSALTGAVIVMVYYLPMYVFPDFFSSFENKINFLGTKVSFNYLTASISLFWIVVEIVLLSFINIQSVTKTAIACGFPDKRDPHHDLHLEQLINLGMDAKNKETLKFGIDPFSGLPKIYIFFFTVWNLLKATLTNFAIKLVFIKIFARLSIRAYADLVGVPVFAIWNAIAARRVIENTKVYIMAPGTIDALLLEIKCLGEDQGFKQNIYDAMQYVAKMKRNFHHNHYVLTLKLIEAFDLHDFKDVQQNETAFLDNIKVSPDAVKKAYTKLVFIGMIIDGEVSRKEKKILNHLYQNGIININPGEINKWCTDFKNGVGLEELIKL